MDVVVVASAVLDGTTRAELRALWDDAYGGRFTDDDEGHAYGGVHVVVRDGSDIVGHASAVPRCVRFGDEPWREIGYVEAVAVDPGRQGRGIGSTVMRTLHPEIASRWPVAMLSTGRATPFYETLGWERWRGPSHTWANGHAAPDDEHGGLMILRDDRSGVPDLTVRVTCEDRPGSAW